MKEIVFINRNLKRWKKFEQEFSSGTVNVDELGDSFIRLTDDLSYSRTFYPGTKTSTYLNQLASRVHQIIYRNKKEKRGGIKRFFLHELPLTNYKNRKKILYSFLIFISAILIGVISSANDDNFVRLIMGDTYVNMTQANIDKGDPMAVYKQANEMDMFLGITVNNIRVAFIAYIMGLFLSFGSGYILFTNGIMLGAFQYFFYQKGLLLESVLTIWIHGTLEISAIIIAGGAGMVMGNSILFPGTYSRGVSFIRAAREGIKMVTGLVPVFIVAGFFEGFLTRHTDLPYFIRTAVILFSLAFVIWYFIIFPIKISKKENNGNKPG